MSDGLSVSEVCDGAADVIEENGWRQGGLWEGHSRNAPYGGGPVCLVGGMAVASGSGASVLTPQGYVAMFDHPAVVAVADFIGWGRDRKFVWGWNDESCRSQEEVVQVLRDVAVKYRSDEFRSG